MRVAKGGPSLLETSFGKAKIVADPNKCERQARKAFSIQLKNTGRSEKDIGGSLSFHACPNGFFLSKNHQIPRTGRPHWSILSAEGWGAENRP